MKKVEWKTKDNRNVVVKIEKASKEISLDGHIVSVDDLKITATVNGVVIGTGRPEGLMSKVVAAKIGKLGITSENLDRINNAIDEIENVDCDSESYEYMDEQMERMMNI